MGKIVFWAVLIGWLFIGLCLMIGCLRRESTANQIEKTPAIVAFVCLIGGPIILIYGIISTTILWFKDRKNGQKVDQK